MSEAPFVYHFDHATGEYLGMSSADTDPMEAGRWVILAFTTLLEPSAPQEGFVAAFVGGEWIELMDSRGQKWWNAAKEPVVVDFLGDPAERGLSDEEPEPVSRHEPVMQPLTARQLRLGLIMNGLYLEHVADAIDAIEAPQDRSVAKIDWEYASQFERSHPLIERVGGALGLSTEQVDSM
jgi:hypothetical protein